jgi:hypothetical protein
MYWKAIRAGRAAMSQQNSEGERLKEQRIKTK